MSEFKVIAVEPHDNLHPYATRREHVVLVTADMEAAIKAADFASGSGEVKVVYGDWTFVPGADALHPDPWWVMRGVMKETRRSSVTPEAEAEQSVTPEAEAEVEDQPAGRRRRSRA